MANPLLQRNSDMEDDMSDNQHHSDLSDKDEDMETDTPLSDDGGCNEFDSSRRHEPDIRSNEDNVKNSPHCDTSNTALGQGTSLTNQFVSQASESVSDGIEGIHEELLQKNLDVEDDIADNQNHPVSRAESLDMLDTQVEPVNDVLPSDNGGCIKDSSHWVESCIGSDATSPVTLPHRDTSSSAPEQAASPERQIASPTSQNGSDGIEHGSGEHTELLGQRDDVTSLLPSSLTACIVTSNSAREQRASTNRWTASPTAENESGGAEGDSEDHVDQLHVGQGNIVTSLVTSPISDTSNSAPGQGASPERRTASPRAENESGCTECDGTSLVPSPISDTSNSAPVRLIPSPSSNITNSAPVQETSPERQTASPAAENESGGAEGDSGEQVDPLGQGNAVTSLVTSPISDTINSTPGQGASPEGWTASPTAENESGGEEGDSGEQVDLAGQGKDVTSLVPSPHSHTSNSAPNQGASPERRTASPTSENESGGAEGDSGEQVDLTDQGKDATSLVPSPCSDTSNSAPVQGASPERQTASPTAESEGGSTEGGFEEQVDPLGPDAVESSQTCGNESDRPTFEIHQTEEQGTLVELPDGTCKFIKQEPRSDDEDQFYCGMEYTQELGATTSTSQQPVPFIKQEAPDDDLYYQSDGDDVPGETASPANATDDKHVESDFDSDGWQIGNESSPSSDIDADTWNQNDTSTFVRCKRCKELVYSADLPFHQNVCEGRQNRAKKKQEHQQVWKCKTCGMKFKRKSLFKIHNHLHKMQSQSVLEGSANKTIYSCLQNIKEIEENIREIEQTGDDKKTNCLVCGQCFVSDTVTMIRYHEMMHMLYPYHCQKCHLFFDNLDSFKGECQAGKSHKVYKYKCKLCKKRMLSVDKMLRHFKKCTGERAKEVCGLCNKKFQSYQELHEHVEECVEIRAKSTTVLSNPTIGQECGPSGASLVQNRGLEHKKNDHMDLSQSYKSQTSLIGTNPEKETKKQVQLESGLYDATACTSNEKILEQGQSSSSPQICSTQSEHSERDPLACDACGTQFYHLSQLNEHKRKRKHDAIQFDDCITNSRKLPRYYPKEWYCKRCKMMFSSELNLSRHQKHCHNGRSQKAHLDTHDWDMKYRYRAKVMPWIPLRERDRLRLYDIGVNLSKVSVINSPFRRKLNTGAKRIQSNTLKCYLCDIKFFDIASYENHSFVHMTIESSKKLVVKLKKLNLAQLESGVVLVGNDGCPPKQHEKVGNIKVDRALQQNVKSCESSRQSASDANPDDVLMEVSDRPGLCEEGLPIKANDVMVQPTDESILCPDVMRQNEIVDQPEKYVLPSDGDVDTLPRKEIPANESAEVDVLGSTDESYKTDAVKFMSIEKKDTCHRGLNQEDTVMQGESLSKPVDSTKAEGKKSKQSRFNVNVPAPVELECVYCSSKFSHQSTLERHMKLHVGRRRTESRDGKRQKWKKKYQKTKAINVEIEHKDVCHESINHEYVPGHGEKTPKSSDVGETDNGYSRKSCNNDSMKDCEPLQKQVKEGQISQLNVVPSFGDLVGRAISYEVRKQSTVESHMNVTREETECNNEITHNSEKKDQKHDLNAGSASKGEPEVNKPLQNVKLEDTSKETQCRGGMSQKSEMRDDLMDVDVQACTSDSYDSGTLHKVKITDTRNRTDSHDGIRQNSENKELVDDFVPGTSETWNSDTMQNVQLQETRKETKCQSSEKDDESAELMDVDGAVTSNSELQESDSFQNSDSRTETNCFDKVRQKSERKHETNELMDVGAVTCNLESCANDPDENVKLKDPRKETRCQDGNTQSFEKEDESDELMDVVSTVTSVSELHKTETLQNSDIKKECYDGIRQKFEAKDDANESMDVDTTTHISESYESSTLENAELQCIDKKAACHDITQEDFICVAKNPAEPIGVHGDDEVACSSKSCSNETEDVKPNEVHTDEDENAKCSVQVPPPLELDCMFCNQKFSHSSTLGRHVKLHVA